MNTSENVSRPLGFSGYKAGQQLNHGFHSENSKQTWRARSWLRVHPLFSEADGQRWG